MHGKGVYYYQNGDRFEGDSKEGKRIGKGVYYFQNGNVYDGEFNDGKMHGFGVYQCLNGDRYVGPYKGINDLYIIEVFIELHRCTNIWYRLNTLSNT